MNEYFDQMILSATPVELVRLLFQRAIAKVREARVHLAAGRIEERSAAINNAYLVVAELMNSIDPGPAPDLANRLKALYCYVQKRLVDANLRQEDKPLADVLGVLCTIGEAWSDMAAASTPKPNPWAMPEMLREEATSVVLTA